MGRNAVMFAAKRGHTETVSAILNYPNYSLSIYERLYLVSCGYFRDSIRLPSFRAPSSIPTHSDAYDTESRAQEPSKQHHSDTSDKNQKPQNPCQIL